MNVQAGSSIGPYEIVGLLGAGGMGEVYRARDSRLGREIALKILPPDLSADADRLHRFTREARLASSLNHPNVVTLHEVGEASGVHYLAMELVEGRSLRELMNKGPVTLRPLLQIGSDIADGLAHAHRASVVHRDLKPANVMVTREGRAKILDFGVAKQVLTAEAAASAVTRANTQTTAGDVVGTTTYMSPEQVRGETVDYRSDQFSFGVVLHEMATGVHPFAQNSTFQTISAITDLSPPPVTSLRSELPAPLAWMVARCLEKDPADRYDSTSDLARDLRALVDHVRSPDSQVGRPPITRRRIRSATLIGSGVLLALVVGLIAGWRWNDQRAVVSSPTFRQLTFRRGTVISARFSADGRTIVYSAAWDGRPSEVHVVFAERPEATRPELPPASILAVSPTGELAISRNCNLSAGSWDCAGTLATASVGGASRDLSESVVAADWHPDGKTMAVVRRLGARAVLEYPRGTVLYESEFLSHARVSPDGQLVAFVSNRRPGLGNNTIEVVDASRQSRVLASGLRFPSGLAWSPDGSEVWFSSSSVGGFHEISAVTLDGRRRTVERQMGDVRLHDINRDGRVLASRLNRRVDLFVKRDADAARPLSWFDFSVLDAMTDDGETVLFSERGVGGATQSYALFLRNISESAPARLGEGRGVEISADRQWVLADVTPQQTPIELTLYPIGSGEPRVLVRGTRLNGGAASFLPNGRGVIFAGEASGSRRTFTVSLDGGAPVLLAHEAGVIVSPLAPDGLRFISQRDDGRHWIARVDGGDASPVPAITRNDFPIQWSADGTGIYLQTLAADLTPVLTKLEVASGRRHPIATIRAADPAGLQPGFSRVHITPDGRTMMYSEHRILSDLFLIEGLK